MSQNLRSSIAAEGPVSFVSTLVSNIINKLISPAIQQLSVDFGIDDELNKLKMILASIHPLLVEAEERQLAEIYFKLWLSAFKDAAYEIEDLLDDLNYGARRKSINQENNIKKVLYSCFFTNTITSIKLCWRVNIIINKINDLKVEIHRFGFLTKRVPRIFDHSRPQTHSYVDKETVIGREKDKEDIVGSLISYAASNKKKIMVLPIVAMGGMEKTTLSQLIYIDHRVKSHFQLRIWVCVSDADFNVTRIVRQIVEVVATKKECDFLSLEQLQKKLREIISGKRCLIVLDDVWNENLNVWEKLKTLLDYGGEGSAVVVTTRSIQAAKIMTTHTIHYLEQLSEEDSWELFRRRAFAKDTEEPEYLVKIGKDIVKRCNGLPLAIVTIGGMMRHENDEVKWKDVLNSKTWQFDAANNFT